MLRTWRNQSDGDQHSQWVPIRSASFRDYLKSLISGRTGVGIANVQHGVVVCGLYRPCLPQLYLQRQVLHEEHELKLMAVLSISVPTKKRFSVVINRFLLGK